MGTAQIKLRWQHLACSVNTYTMSEAAPQSSLNRENVSCQLLRPATSCTRLFPPQILPVHLHRDINGSGNAI